MSDRDFQIRVARRLMLANGIAYRKAKAGLNTYSTSVGKSISWWYFNRSRHHYLKAIKQLREALR